MHSTPELRGALVARLQQLIGREEKIASHLQGKDGRLEADFGDIANFVASDEVLEGLEDAALAEISQIRAAIGRMETGTYGLCAGCGEGIPLPRLRAVPAATRCIACAS
jgi:DnaK suppressor protein